MIDKKDNWGKYLDAAVFATNTSVHASTRVTPFHMMFGREPRFPLEAEMKGAGDDAISEMVQSINDIDHEIFLDSLIAQQKNLFETAEKNIKTAQKKQVEQYRKRKGIFDHKFVEGDEVLRRNMKQKTRKGSKSEDRWLGPYTIIELSATSCVLINLAGKRLKRRVNLNQLKPYKTDSM